MTKLELLQSLRRWKNCYEQAEKIQHEKYVQMRKAKEELDSAKNLAEKNKPYIEEPLTVVGAIITWFVFGLIGTVILGVAAAVIQFFATIIRILYETFVVKEITLENPVLIQLVDFASKTLHFPDNRVVTYILISAIVSAIVCVPLVVMMYLENDRIPEKNRRRVEEYEKLLARIPPIESEYRKAVAEHQRAADRVDYWVKQSVVTQEYIGYVDDIIKLLQNGRADTLKEALNVLEADRSRRRIESENARHNREMERISEENYAILQEEARRSTAASERAARASERAAEAAEDAAFFEQASMFINASALDKIRKDINEK